MRPLRTSTRYPSKALLAILAAILGMMPLGACKRSAPKAVPERRVNIPAHRSAYVTNNGSDSISVFDREGSEVTQFSLDLDADLHEAPHHLALRKDRGEIFVALAYPAPPKPKAGPHGNHGNAETRGKIARLDLSTLAFKDTKEVDHNPGEIILSRDGSRVLVTHFDMKRAMNVAAAAGSTSAMFATLQVWNSQTLTLEASRPLCVAPHGAVVGADNRWALVACYGSDELAIVDLTTPTLTTAKYPLGAAQGVPGAPAFGPYSVALSPDGTKAVVATLESHELRIFDMAERKFLHERTFQLRAKAYFPEFVSANSVVVPLQGPDGLARVDIQTRQVEARVAFAKDQCQGPHAAKRARDGRLYVVCEGDHESPGVVMEVDPQSLQSLRSWAVGVYPDGIAFGDD